MNIEVISSYGSNAFSSLLQWGGGEQRKRQISRERKQEGPSQLCKEEILQQSVVRKACIKIKNIFPGVRRIFRAGVGVRGAGAVPSWAGAG